MGESGPFEIYDEVTGFVLDRREYLPGGAVSCRWSPIEKAGPDRVLFGTAADAAAFLVAVYGVEPEPSGHAIRPATNRPRPAPMPAGDGSGNGHAVASAT